MSNMQSSVTLVFWVPSGPCLNRHSKKPCRASLFPLCLGRIGPVSPSNIRNLLLCFGWTVERRMFHRLAAVSFVFGNRSLLHTMFRFIVLALSSVAFGLRTDAATQQTLPAINVQYDFPASETLLSKQQVLDASGQDKAFQGRVRSMHRSLDRMSDVAERFVQQAGVDLDRLLAVVQASSS